MEKNKDLKIRPIIIKLSETLANEFISYCDTNGYTMSKRIRLLIERDLKANNNEQ